MGGQTIFIWCPLKYTSSVSINLNLQHYAVRHYATAALWQAPDPKEERILHIPCDFAHDW